MENNTGLYLKKMFQAIKKQMNKDLTNLDLTSAQANVLIYLCKNKNKIIIQRDIEKKFELTNPTVNGILNRLENKGFIQRITSSQDARNKEIHLTEKSLLLDKEMIKKANCIERKIRQGISDEEIIIFNEILQKMLNNILNEEEK